MGFIYKKKNTVEKPRIIGVAGTGRAVGTTHLCVLAANYLCGACGRTTAVLEWNSHGDFARFGNACTGLSEAEKCFRIQEVDFYPESAGDVLAECLHKGYEEILIDFGSLMEQDSQELLRCHRVLLMVSFSEWQMEAPGKTRLWEECAERNGWLCLAAFGSEESRIRWNKRRRPAVKRIPLSADAFTVTQQVMEFMKTIL